MFTGVLITHPADGGWGVPAIDWASLMCQWPKQAVTRQLHEGQTSSVAPLRRTYTPPGTIPSTLQFKFRSTEGSESPQLQWPGSSGSAAALLACAPLLSPSPQGGQEWVHGLPLPHAYWLFRARKFLGRHLKMVFAGWCKYQELVIHLNTQIFKIRFTVLSIGASLSGSDGKESACNGGDPGLIPGSGRSPGKGNGHQLLSITNRTNCKMI